MSGEARIVVLLLDGFGLEYWDGTPLPAMKQMASEGIFRRGRAVFPTLTNANNISLVTGAWPSEHGVTTNCYFDELAGEARFLEDPAFILAPTIFHRARRRGVSSALLTCKAKTLCLLGGATDLAVSAEAPTNDVRARWGSPPPMYSTEVNEWLLSVALRILQERPEIGLLYVHTTDFPMHAWPPEAPESQAHLSMVDSFIARMRESAPDATFLVTADHGMNSKTRCIDLVTVCADAGLPLRFAVSPVADRLLRHHRGFGGVAYAYLRRPEDERAISAHLLAVPGVEAVLPRADAAAWFRLMPKRIGDLVVLPDRDTVFGDLGAPEEWLAPGYRNHGSLHEQEVPLLAHGPAVARLLPDEPQYNLDLTRRPYRAPRGRKTMRTQRVVVGLLDGFDPDYLEKSEMPALAGMAREGISTQVQAVFPTVTNVNNVSVCCGAWPDEHGISANSYYDPSSGAAVYMNAAELVRAPTLFERAAAAGVSSALLTCKRKTVELLHRGASIAIAAEAPTPELVARYGPPGNIYSAGINHWLWMVAVDLLRTRPDIGVLYVHTTDYPMHRWGPDEPESRDHLARLDSLLGEARAAAPDAAFLFTADHGMHAKNRCWDLARVCQEARVPLRFALSPERDYYVAHHRNFTGCAWLWLCSPSDEGRVRDTLKLLPGVEGLLDRREAASRFRQPPEQIGDLTVLGDADTMFGELDAIGEKLNGYRAHGSLHEARVPLVIHGGEGAPPREEFRTNLDLARWVFKARP